MNTFLHIVANDIISKYGNDLSHIAVVFPNKRASLFLNEELYRCAGKPVWAPTYLTISELFRESSPYTVGDQLKLVSEVYKSYTSVTLRDETLDHFFDWGKLLISDFDDIDKNMADADKLFANIANIHELDDVTYLTDEQREVLRNFFANFSEDHNSKLKEMFLSLWSKLNDIYHDFRDRLHSQGISYEGMMYRDVVENDRMKPKFDKYLFVGFNLLQKVELSLFRNIKDMGIGEFYWDFDYYYCSSTGTDANKVKEAGKYISAYIKILGNSLSDEYRKEAYDNFRGEKNISFVKAKTEDIQARYVSQWLQCGQRAADGKRTAIVMCDESLLTGVLHAFPSGMGNINVTTGFPLSQTTLASFVSQLLDLQVCGTRNDGGFRISLVRRLLRHPYLKLLSCNSPLLLTKLQEEHILYPSPADLQIDDILGMVFNPQNSNSSLLEWLIAIMKELADRSEEVLFVESVFNMYTILNRLKALGEAGDLQVDRITLQKLTKQIIASTAIPFHGEPAVGIQVMGLLETRNLDFDHIILLSCNEGNMPKGIRDSSFVPYSIRKAYGLTTVDNKVAIYSYYFYRLLQRAKDITIVYNTSTDNGNQGEMSRFMLQLMVESGHEIKHLSLHAGQTTLHSGNMRVTKDERIMKILDNFSKLSPTAINQYIRCKMRFYYNYIAGIREPDEDIEEQLSNRAFGNIFHNSLELIYKDFADGRSTITSDVIDKLAEQTHIESVVDRMFQREMFGEDESRWRKINYNGIQLLSRTVLIRYVKQMLEIDRRLTPFKIIGLEKDMYMPIDVTVGQNVKSLRVGGRIDRLDMVSNKENGTTCIRVIDYKTGSKDISKPIPEVADIFDSQLAGSDYHTDYYLQAMLYSLIVRNSREHNPQILPVSPALVFIQHAFGEDYDPVVSIGKKKVDDVAEYGNDYKDGLKSVLSELFDQNNPFTPTSNQKLCEYCPYRTLCSR